VDRTVLLEDIRTLISAPLGGDQSVDRARVERTLTDGYAHALALEAERLQIERRMEHVTARIGAGERNGVVGELSRLSQQLGSTERSLAELRTLLASLRDRVRR